MGCVKIVILNVAAKTNDLDKSEIDVVKTVMNKSKDEIDNNILILRLEGSKMNLWNI